MTNVPPPLPPRPTPPAAHSPFGVPPPPNAPATPRLGSGPGGFRPGDIRPKQRWIWFSVAVFAVGVAAAVATGILGVLGISEQIDGFERVQRGAGTIEIEERREFVVYSEEGTRFARVTILDPDGQEVRTRPSSTSLTYSFGSRSGVAVSTFDARVVGTYTVETDTDIAIGPSIAGSILRAIAVPFVVGGAAFLVGAVMLIVVLVRRSRSKTRLIAG